jgi:isopentenyl-diphosphate delta-isomerase
VLANLGAVQLNYGFGLDECRTAVDMIEADALVFHLNVLQEALQPEGQTDFRGLLDAMAAVAAKLDVPVAVKEVGCGLSEDVGRALVERGIRILDSSGLGGTSWARIEARRSGDVELGEMFADWGIPTPESIRQLARIDGATVIGSGGLRSGVDAAKAIALGADLAAMAYPFLEPATESAAAVEARIARIVQELRIAMLCAGVRDVRTLQEAKLVERSMP